MNLTVRLREEAERDIADSAEFREATQWSCRTSGANGYAMRKLIALLVIASICGAALAQNALSHPDPANHYLFYLHGRVIEDGDLRPTHPVWGVYDYPAVVEALGSRGAVVISEQRPKDTDVAEYAARVRDQILELARAGVPQSHISVVGFSKGGTIAIAVSGLMPRQYDGIRYVFLGACTDWVLEQPELTLTGRALSIYEASDETTGSCKGLAEHRRNLAATSEVTIDTGTEHGAFYTPREAWLAPTLQWVHGA